jgi:hypothetical protein
MFIKELFSTVMLMYRLNQTEPATRFGLSLGILFFSIVLPLTQSEIISKLNILL